MKWENIGSQLHCRQGPRLEDKGIRLLMDKLWKYWGGSFLISGIVDHFSLKLCQSVSIQTMIVQRYYHGIKLIKLYFSYKERKVRNSPSLKWSPIFSVADSTQIVSSLNLILHIPALSRREIWARNILFLNWDKKRNISTPELRNDVLLEIQYEVAEGKAIEGTMLVNICCLRIIL